MKHRLLLLLVSAVIVSCSESNTIHVELSPEKLIVDGRKIRKADFYEILKAIANEKLERRIERHNLIINMRVSDRTKRGEIADIETSLRKLNIRRVTYSTFSE